MARIMGLRPCLENPGSTIGYCVHTPGTNHTSSLSISLLFFYVGRQKNGRGLLKVFGGRVAKICLGWVSKMQDW